MQTIEIKGKEYVPVAERIKEFHHRYSMGDITTEIVSNDENRVIVKATIKYSLTGSVWSTFTGFSQASWKTGMMKDVALEVAETSAVGRALGFANIGLLDGIASAEEMRKVGKQKAWKGVQDAEGDPIKDDDGD